MKYRILYILFLLLSLDCQAITDPVKFLRVCPLGANDAVLNWLVPPDNCGSFRSYYIYGRILPTGPFTLIDSVNTYFTSQYVHAGQASAGWKYFIVARFLCDNMTPAPSSDTLTIDNFTKQTTLDSVSVDVLNNRIVVGWEKSTEKDLRGYDVYLVAGTSAALKSLVINNTFYISSPEDPKTQSFKYKVDVKDSCDNLSALSNGHRTILLQMNGVDTCLKTVDLGWTHYYGVATDEPGNPPIGWPVGKYEIYVSKNLGTFFKVGEVDGLINSFKYTGLTLGDSLTFFVRAFSSSTAASSSSNTVGILTRARPKPAFCYLRCADVIEETKTKLTWFPDLSGEISYFKVYRSTDGVNYAVLPNSKISSDLTSEKSFTDDQSPASSGRTYYKIGAFDICDSPLVFSNVAITTYLSATTMGTESVIASWSGYSGFENGVKNYQIFRGVNLGGGLTWKNLDLVKDSSYKDKKLPDDVGEDGICYRVLAYENGPNKYGFSDSCNSNTYCAQQPIIAFFPTAFVPTGVNTVFKPVCSFVNKQTSFFTIYNRWGGVVKTVNDITQGWDGTNDSGKPMPEGVYIYYATLYGSLNGITRIYSGSFYLFNSE